MDDMQPGQIIIPHSPDDSKPAGDGAPVPERPSEQPAPPPPPLSTPDPVEPPAAPQPTEIAASTETAAPAADWQFRQEADPTVAAQPPPAGLNWTASEFIAHEKTGGWYGMLAVFGVAAAALIYFLTKDRISTGVVLLTVAAFGIFAGRKPRTQSYALSSDGLEIGNRLYGFPDLKTFSIAEEGAIVSIVFMPLKRFMPPLTIYLAPDMEEQVVDFLAAYLPLEPHKADAVDSLLRRIHF